MNWEGTKTCHNCKEKLPKTNFSPNQGETDRLKSQCKECSALNTLKVVSIKTGNKLSLPEGFNGHTVRKIKKRQKNRCYLCRQPEGERNLHLDHDHVTGLIRGMVCNTCNRTLVPTLEKYPILRKNNPKWIEFFNPKKNLILP
jgi:hypothetical protein